MAYTAPTPTDLKARFPTFAAVDDAVITKALTEAARMVDESWTEGDYAPARMYYAAHVLIIDGFGDSKEAKIAGLTLSGLTSIKISSLAVGFAKPGASSGSKTLTWMSSTSYGQRFLSLLRLNKPALVVADGSA